MKFNRFVWDLYRNSEAGCAAIESDISAHLRGYFSVASNPFSRRRGFWVFRGRGAGFPLDHFIFKTWNELAHPDVLHEISLFLGKRAVDIAAKSVHKPNRATIIAAHCREYKLYSTLNRRA